MIEFKCTRNGGKTLNQMNWPQEFFRYLLVEKGYSDKTKEAYEEDISDFFEFLKSSGDENYLQIDHRDVRVVEIPSVVKWLVYVLFINFY